MRVVDVLVPVALDQAYSYRVPAGLELAPGDLVAVPLGPRETLGVVWAENPNPNPRLHNRLKDIDEKLDIPPLKPELRQFVDWVAGYTLAARGMVLRMALRMGEHLGPARERVGVRLAGPAPQRMTTARARVLDLFRDGLTRAKGDAARDAGVSAGVIDGLIDEGTLETLVLPPEKVAQAPDPDFAKPDFALGQLAAADALRTTVAQGGYTVTLLDGVTGSGKTEVYFEAVAENIRRGHQTLILMPEIALTAQFLDRFSARFGVRPAEWHSQLTPRLRQRTWAAGRRQRGAGGGRRALGAVPALRRSRPDHRRRGARPRLQAGGRRPLQRARHGGGARDVSPRFRWCWPRPRPRSSRKSMRGAGATGICICRSVSAARHLPMVEPIDLRREGPPRGRFIAPRLAEAVQMTLERKRTGTAVPQPARLCAAHIMPRLRLPPAMPELRRLAGRSSFQQTAGLPSLRLLHAAAGGMPELPRHRKLRRSRPRRRAAGAGGGGAVSRRRASWCCRAISSNRSTACAANWTTWRKGDSTWSSARNWWPRAIISPSSIWSASSMPISGSAMAIRAPPSARFSSCIRWSAAPGARRAGASATCRRISPSIR